MRSLLRDLLRPIGGFARIAITLGVVGALLIAVLSTSALFVAHSTIEAAPELPDPGVDVAAIDDLTAATERTSSQASVLLDIHGEVYGRFQPEETYLPYQVGEVPEIVERVLTAAEDENFRSHSGFDPKAIVRAFARNARSGGIEQGGSTLTQQLAKNLFTGSDNSLERKLQELQVAIDIEEQFSKDEILTAYANSVFLGSGAYGFEAASVEYFHKPSAELTLSEAALLVGVLPAPSERDPRRHPEAAEQARQTVLRRVAEVGAATRAEVDEALATPPEVLERRKRVERFPYYVDYVRRYLLDEQGMDPDLLYEGGLTIETAMDPELQGAARWAVGARLPGDSGVEAALAVVDVRTGLVPAIIGGRSFEGAQVNLALGREGGGTGRQAGSSFKTFVLATALEQGIVPEQRIDAPREYLPTTVDDPKPVGNFSGGGHGTVTLFQATLQSINTAYVQLTEHVGAKPVRDLATRMGVEDLPEWVGPSIGIGAYETSPLDMARAYAGFATEGRRVDSGPVTRVLDPQGEVVADFTPTAPEAREQVISPETAQHVNQILQANVEQGTATRAQIGRPAAAKTGTADDFTNAWLAGHTPQYATAVWLGYPDSNVPMYGIAGFGRITGGSLPALIWHDVMGFAHRNEPPAAFTPPPPPPPPFPGTIRVEGDPDQER